MYNTVLCEVSKDMFNFVFSGINVLDFVVPVPATGLMTLQKDLQTIIDPLVSGGYYHNNISRKDNLISVHIGTTGKFDSGIYFRVRDKNTTGDMITLNRESELFSDFLNLVNKYTKNIQEDLLMKESTEIKHVVSGKTAQSEVIIAKEAISCSVSKKMRIKVFEGGKAPKYKNGNWIDTFIRKVGRLKKVYVHDEFTIDDPMIEWFDKGSVRYDEGDILVCKLGFALELLPKHELHLVPRGGTFRKTGLLLTNSMGVGDDNFIGENDEYSAMLYATRTSHISIGDRLIQMRVEEAMGDKYSFETVTSFNNGCSDRGAFGTTGK